MPHRAIRNLCSNRLNSLVALQCTLKSLRLGGFLLADHRRFPRLLRDHYRVSLVGSSGLTDDPGESVSEALHFPDWFERFEVMNL